MERSEVKSEGLQLAVQRIKEEEAGICFTYCNFADKFRNNE